MSVTKAKADFPEPERIAMCAWISRLDLHDVDYSASNISRLKACQMACMCNELVVHDFILSLGPKCHIFQDLCWLFLTECTNCLFYSLCLFKLNVQANLTKPLHISNPFHWIFYDMMENENFCCNEDSLYKRNQGTEKALLTSLLPVSSKRHNAICGVTTTGIN